MVDRIATKPNFSQGVWAESGTLINPSSDKIQVGHIVEKPPYQTVNWVENRQDNGILYILQNGLSSWSKDLFYPQYALITRNGVVYQALQQNTGQDPLTKTSYWEKAFYSYTDGSKLATFMKNVIEVDGYLDLYVSKANPVLTGVAKGVGYSFSIVDDEDGLFHDKGTPVMKNDGVVVAKFEKIESITEQSKRVVTMDVLQEALRSHQGIKVGGLYLTMSNANPLSELGYGEWTLESQGCCLVGLSTQNSSPNWTRQIGNSFGEYEHTLSIDELPKHRFKVRATQGGTQQSAEDWDYVGETNGHANDDVADSWGYMKSNFVGGDQPHNNVQPSLVVAIWRRIG